MDYNLTPVDQQKLNNMIDECVTSKFRQDSETQFRKDVAARAKEELGFTTSDFNSLVAERYQNKSTDALEKHQEIVDLNEILTKNRGMTDNHTEDDSTE